MYVGSAMAVRPCCTRHRITMLMKAVNALLNGSARLNNHDRYATMTA